jgi:hypothetical protein
MTYNPTKYESYPASGYRGEAVTRTGLTDGQTDGRTDDGQQAIRIAHLSFQLRWAKNTAYEWSLLSAILIIKGKNKIISLPIGQIVESERGNKQYFNLGLNYNCITYHIAMNFKLTFMPLINNTHGGLNAVICCSSQVSHKIIHSNSFSDDTWVPSTIWYKLFFVSNTKQIVTQQSEFYTKCTAQKVLEHFIFLVLTKLNVSMVKVILKTKLFMVPIALYIFHYLHFIAMYHHSFVNI